MNVFIIIEFGVEAESNGHWDRLIWHRWICFWGVGVVEGSEYVVALPTTLHELKTQIKEACSKTEQEILGKVWREVEFRFDIARVTRGARIELY